MLLLWWSCTQSVEPDMDRKYYLEALKEPHRALEICPKISNDDVQGECVLFAATEGGHGSEACGYAHMEKWKEACFFEVIDKQGVPKHQAKDSCARTGRFQNRCVYHIIQREEQQWMKRFPMGKEQELSLAIQEEIILLGGVELPNDPLSDTLVSRIVARRFLKAWRVDSTIRFPSTYCGNIEQEGCKRAYRFVIRLGRKMPKPCGVPPSFDALTLAKIPRWENDFYDEALQVWSELCR